MRTVRRVRRPEFNLHGAHPSGGALPLKAFVFWAAVISVVSGVGLQLPAVSAQLMPTEQPGMLLHVFGLMAAFIGATLILCSRDLTRRGPLVAWEGVLRLGGFVVMAGYGMFGGCGPPMLLAGVFDLAVGLIYLIGLPRHLGAPLLSIMLDRMSEWHT